MIADYSLPGHRSRSRDAQVSNHEIAPDMVRAELQRARYQVVRCEDPLVKRKLFAWGYSIQRGDLWLMVAVRPK